MEIIDIILCCLCVVFVLIVLFGLSVSNYAGKQLLDTYKEYKKYRTFVLPLDFAEIINNAEFNGSITANIVNGYLSDHYVNKTINVSYEVAQNPTVPALSIVAHELGHALQYRDIPKKMNVFVKKLMLSKILSKLMFPLFLCGIICTILSYTYIGIALLFASLLVFIIGLFVKLNTIKIEADASARAIELLKTYADFDDVQIKIAKKFLNCAKLTYIASFLRSLLKWTMLVNKYNFY